MVEILRNKNLATRFQIMVEIAHGGPNIQQQDVAKKLGITPQAVSDYIRQLSGEGLLTSGGRSRYRVTDEGVNWIIAVYRELRSYNALVEKAITNISVCTAIAGGDLIEGQSVGLEMREGLLFATDGAGAGARGVACSGAKAGEDVGVSGIEGIVSLKRGKVTILKVPGTRSGGSGMVDLKRLKKEIGGGKIIGAIGIEALVALKRAGGGFVYSYGVIESAVEAANSGLSPFVVCVEDMTSPLVRRLEEEKIDCEFIDLRKG